MTIQSAETAVALVEGSKAELSHLLGTTHPWATSSSSSSSGFEQGRSSNKTQRCHIHIRKWKQPSEIQEDYYFCMAGNPPRRMESKTISGYSLKWYVYKNFNISDIS